jgi:DNA-binding transcriptional LysR family regulator
VAEHVLPRALEAMQHEHPDVLVDVHASDDFVDLVREGFDLALRMGPLPDSTLQARKLVSFRLVACAAPSLVARLGTPSHPSALASLPCLHYGSGPKAPMWKFIHASGESVRVTVDCRLRSNNLSLLETLAVGGMGFVRLPEWTAAEALRTGRLVRVLDQWGGADPRRVPTMFAVHPKDEGKAGLRAVFLAALERAVQP